MHTVSYSAALAVLAGNVLASPVITGNAEDGDAIMIDWITDADEHPISFEAPDSLLGPATTSGFVFGGSDPEGDGPSDAAFTPDGSQFIISHIESSNLIVWDTATRAFVREIALPGRPVNFAITPDGTTAVAALVDTDQVAIADLATGVVTSVVPVGTNPGVVRILPAGDVAVVGVTGTADVVVIDIATGVIVRTIPSIGFGQTLSFSPEASAVSLRYTEFEVLDADRVVNVDSFAGELQFINARTGAVTRTPIAANASSPPAISGDGTTVAVSHTSSTRLLTIADAATEAVTSTIPTTVDLRGPGVLNQDGSRGLVTVSNNARAFDVSAGTFGASNINTASIRGFLRSNDGSRAFGIGFFGSVIDIDTGTLLGNFNNQVSVDLGAVSPVTDLALTCSTTFGDDYVLVEIDPTPSLIAFELTGPPPEADKVRTVAISDDGATALGVSILSDTVSIVDTATSAVTGWASVGQRPSGIAVTPDGTRAVVANLDSTFASVVDLAAATTTNIPISRRASQVEISPDGNFAYLPVVASGDGVWRIDLTTNTVAGPKILTGNMGGVGYSYSQSSGMDLSSDGSLLATAGSFTNDVSIIDTTTWTLLANVPVGAFPSYVEFTPDGSRLIATNKNDDTLSVIDTNTLTVTSTILVGDAPGELAATDDGRVFVINSADDTIDVVDLDLAFGVVVATLPIPDATIVSIEADSVGRRLLVAEGNATTSLGGTDGFAQSQEGRLRVYDLDTLALLETIDTGFGPAALAASASGDQSVIAAIQSDGVVLVDLRDCVPDLNGDGFLNNTDVNLFVSLVLSNDAAADLNDDGNWNNTDVNLFVSLFLAGCI